MAPHSSTLAWKIPWTEEPGGLQSMGSLRVGHDWVTSLSFSCVGEGNGNPLHCSCLENPRDGGAWWAAVSGVAQSRTRLKRLSSSILYTMIFIFSPYVRVYSFRYLMNKVLDKFLESGNHASSPRNLQIEVAILGCRRSIHAIRYTECPL